VIVLSSLEIQIALLLLKCQSNGHRILQNTLIITKPGFQVPVFVF